MVSSARAPADAASRQKHSETRDEHSRKNRARIPRPPSRTAPANVHRRRPRCNSIFRASAPRRRSATCCCRDNSAKGIAAAQTRKLTRAPNETVSKTIRNTAETEALYPITSSKELESGRNRVMTSRAILGAVALGILAAVVSGALSPAVAGPSFPTAVEQVLMNQDKGPVSKLPADRKRELIACVNQVLARPAERQEALRHRGGELRRDGRPLRQGGDGEPRRMEAAHRAGLRPSSWCERLAGGAEPAR